MSNPGAIDPLVKLQKELGEVFVHGSNKWSAYNAASLLHRKKPVLGTVNQKEIEEMAKEMEEVYERRRGVETGERRV